MNTGDLINLIIALCSVGGLLFGGIDFYFRRLDRSNEKVKALEESLHKTEQDSIHKSVNTLADVVRKIQENQNQIVVKTDTLSRNIDTYAHSLDKTQTVMEMRATTLSSQFQALEKSVVEYIGSGAYRVKGPKF